jgi:hypothetical protein
MAGQLGPSGLFTGMGARLVMIGTLTAGQCKSASECCLYRLLIGLSSLDLRRHQEGSERQGWCESE